MSKIVVNGTEYKIFNKLYAVSEDGMVIKNYSEVSLNRRKDGYLAVSNYLVHRMVASCWVENKSGGKHVHHKNGNKSDNRATNLEWTTPKEHMGVKHNGSIGKNKCPEWLKEKLRQNRLGKKTSEETKQKQREASLRLGCRPPSWLGRKKTEEQKMKTKIHQFKPCSIDGVIYPSALEAANSLGMKYAKLKARIYSENFTSYFYLKDD